MLERSKISSILVGLIDCLSCVWISCVWGEGGGGSVWHHKVIIHYYYNVMDISVSYIRRTKDQQCVVLYNDTFLKLHHFKLPYTCIHVWMHKFVEEQMAANIPAKKLYRNNHRAATRTDHLWKQTMYITYLVSQRARRVHLRCDLYFLQAFFSCFFNVVI